MAAVPLGLSNYVRKLGASPPIILKNMFLEKDPTNLVDGHVRLQRPGLVPFAVLTLVGPVRGIFKQLGTFNGDFLVVSNSSFFRVTETGVLTRVGSVAAQDRVQIAASQSRALIATGNFCYSTDGTTVTHVNIPDINGVRSAALSVAYINGYFIITLSNSQHFFWIAPGETDPDPLSFASAENSPDNIVDVEHIGDELWFFGEGRSTEVWVPNGDKDLPFTRVEGRLFDQGCANRDTVAKLDNTLFWVGSDSKVYRGDSVPLRISDNAVEELLYNTDASLLRAWAFSFQGHDFYCLTIGKKATLTYDVSTQTWQEFSSYGRQTWRAHLGAQTSGRLIVAGDDESGTLWKLDPTVSNDNGDPLVREVMGGLAVIGRPVPCSSFSFVAATGQANAVPPGDNPVVEMRFSDDFANWSPWYQMRLGKIGEHPGEVALTRLGMMRAPGRLFHLRMTENCMFRLNYARVNEPIAA
jgi:hypothetical protein